MFGVFSQMTDSLFFLTLDIGKKRIMNQPFISRTSVILLICVKKLASSLS